MSQLIRHGFSHAWSLAVVVGVSAPVLGVEITPVDLADLSLGARIVGPVGPEVQVTFINDDDQGVGDLESSVSCPDGIDPCTPPTNPPGTIYTYVHTAIPGVDLPNDPPFPTPDQIVTFDDVLSFRLGFVAEGFNGVAGYDFSQAATALGTSDEISIELEDDGSLTWSIDSDEWDSNEPLTFFWQTTQPPSDPGGVYSINDGAVTGLGAGPLPVPVPQPGVAVTLVVAGLTSLTHTRPRRR